MTVTKLAKQSSVLRKEAGNFGILLGSCGSVESKAFLNIPSFSAAPCN